MSSYDALNAFAAQIERHVAGSRFHTKIVVTPSSVQEKGLVVKVSLLKSFIQTEPKMVRASRMLRVRVSVAGTAESMTGLEQALCAIESLDRYLATPGLRLEAPGSGGARQVPNSRVIQEISPEDSFIDSPDSASVQDVQDDRIVTITIPEGAVQT